MFSKKRANLITNCDVFIDLYNKCNIGCEMCKFNQNIKNIEKNIIDYGQYQNVKVLFCYKTDPYTIENLDLVETAVKKLHQNNCSIVFLTRKANLLFKQLSIFNNKDFVGVSISENCTKNSNMDDIINMLKTAKKLGINTWVSLEPILSSKFANNIIKQIIPFTDFIRIGRDDLIEYDWDNVKLGIKSGGENIFIKE